MEAIGKKEQFALSSRTNVSEISSCSPAVLEADRHLPHLLGSQIMLGVHGNGLSHLMWMPRGSSVVELFWPGSVDLVSRRSHPTSTD